MSTTTLTSLAILKVALDHDDDYLQHLRPFVLQVLVDHRPDPVTAANVSRHIRDDYGLEIPEPTISVVLGRIAKRYPLDKHRAIYRITGDLPDPRLAAKQAESRRHIDAVLEGFRRFSQTSIRPISTDEEAVDSICTFLTKFNISCLRNYLRHTAIPHIQGPRDADIVLVSDYVQHLRKTDLERFESFVVLLQGHMLANALTCPDLNNVSPNYRSVTFYLDTPLLVQLLGADGDTRQDAIRDLLQLLRRLGGRVAAFSHSVDELHSVLTGAAEHLNARNGRGNIVLEARKRGTTKSDLLLLANSIDDKLQEARIEVVATPRHIDEFQIDEAVFEKVLDDGISYRNPRAREYDVVSVRSIFTLRGSKPAHSMERARAVLVTSNSSFARVAWEYGKKHEAFRDVSSVVADFSLANMAWLKVPMGAARVPRTQLLAFSYAALKPSAELLGKYMKEIDRLEEQGQVSARQLQLLRSSARASEELTRLTLGEDTALTPQTLTEIHDRVATEIVEEESAKLTAEQYAHQKTRESLLEQQAREQAVVERLYWRCRRRARVIAWSSTTILMVTCVVGTAWGLGFRPADAAMTLAMNGAGLVSGVFALMNVLIGFTVIRSREWIETRCRAWLLAREAKDAAIEWRNYGLDMK